MHPVHDSITGMLADILKAQPASQAKLDFAWRAAAGPAMARATRVEMDARGTVRVFAPDPNWRREVRRSLPELLGRLAGLLGESVSRLTVSK
jgi:predicted nucleic acid-binding Zn ribbon protein